jgi:hypothetical protein
MLVTFLSYMSTTEADSKWCYLDVPDSYYCPLTFELMVDPVIDPDGHSYERTAIEEWLRINPVSPMTRSLLTIGDLRMNKIFDKRTNY